LVRSRPRPASFQYSRCSREPGSSKDSVTSVPSPRGASWYRQVFMTIPRGPFTEKPKSRPGTLVTTVQFVQ
jgi:hypothetical protein